VYKTLLTLTLFSASALAQQPGMAPDLEEMFFKQFDANQDGVVSEEEFLKPTRAQFEHMDRNRDGVLDQAEVKAFNDEMNQRMKEMQQRMQQQGMPQRMPPR